MMQSKMVDDTDSREGKLVLYRNTIKTQEEVRQGSGAQQQLGGGSEQHSGMLGQQGTG